jgi:diguanylate cyclase (GGDEF)-like protein
VTLRSKMLAMAAIPIAVLAFAVVFAVFAHRAAARANAEVDRANGMRVVLSEVQEDLADAEAAVRGYLLTNRADLLNEHAAAIAKLNRDLTRLGSLLKLPIQRQRLERLHEIADERVATLEEISRLTGSRTRDEQAALNVSLLHATTLTTIQRRVTEEMEADADQTAAAAVIARDAAYHRSYIVQMVAMPAALLIAIVLLLAFTAGIVRRIGWMRANAELLDTGVPMKEPDPSKDELGQLSRAWTRTGSHVIALQDELRRLATIDPLTGLANRRGFYSLAEHTLLLAARTRCAVALLFIDVNGLKLVNDEQGHSAGDAMLVEVGQVITETIRGSDVAGRVGGDEFCVLLVGEPDIDAERVVRRLRETEAAHNARPGRTFAVSMAIGSIVLSAGRTVTLEELIDAADEAMYQDKRDRHGVQPAPDRHGVEPAALA